MEDRDAITRAAAVYDEIEKRTEKLQRDLDEAKAHLEAQKTLIEELRLQLGEERTNSSTYRADAEQARADSAAMLTLFANTKAMFDGFEIPSEKLPMRRKKNGKQQEILPAAAPPLSVAHLDDVEREIGTAIARTD